MKIQCNSCAEKRHWEKAIPAMLFAIRTSVNEGLEFSPAEIVHGKNLRKPLTVLYERWKTGGTEETQTPVVEYVLRIINRIHNRMKIIADQQEVVGVKRKKWYDKRAVKRSFQPGDQVLILTPLKPNRLSMNWNGPGIIEKKLSETNYIVKLPEKENRKQNFHINLLKRYYQREEEVNYLDEKFLDEAEEIKMEIPDISKENGKSLSEQIRISEHLKAVLHGEISFE
jgi:hypothetical protein